MSIPKSPTSTLPSAVAPAPALSVHGLDVDYAGRHGLAPALRESFPPAQRIRLPMMPDNRSLNLSNTVAVVVFEVWRQAGFPGGA